MSIYIDPNAPRFALSDGASRFAHPNGAPHFVLPDGTPSLLTPSPVGSGNPSLFIKPDMRVPPPLSHSGYGATQQLTDQSTNGSNLPTSDYFRNIPAASQIATIGLLEGALSDDAQKMRDRRHCQLVTAQTITALVAMTAYNLSLVLPKYSGLSWGGILLGNAVAFPPWKITQKEVAKTVLIVFGGGLCAFLPGYFLQDQDSPRYAVGQSLSSFFFTTSINLLWGQALKGLDASYKGPQRAFLASAAAVGSYHLAHATCPQPWADFVASVGVIGGNMIAFPPPRGICNRIQKLFFSIVPILLATLANEYSGNEKFNQATTFLGGTISLSIAWYYGMKGLRQQRAGTIQMRRVNG